LSPSAVAATEAARTRLRATRQAAPQRPVWQPPGWDDLFQRRVIIAFDASLVNTGWVLFRAWLAGVDVIGHGTIRPVTEETGYMATWERARQLEAALWDESLVIRCMRDEETLMAVEAPPVGGGLHRTESSLIAGLTVWRQAPGKCAVVSATHVSAVLLGEPGIRSRKRKPAIKAAVARYVPDSSGRGWTEHERDALSVGLTRLFDLKEAA
jgi:hypothetical protein